MEFRDYNFAVRALREAQARYPHAHIEYVVRDNVPAYLVRITLEPPTADRRGLYAYADLEGRPI